MNRAISDCGVKLQALRSPSPQDLLFTQHGKHERPKEAYNVDERTLERPVRVRERSCGRAAVAEDGLEGIG